MLTPDNFLKIYSIYARAKSRLPIVLMGETGFGKTSLIRFLCSFVLDDYFKMINIHAGTTESDIISQTTEFIVKCKQNIESEFWLVFDEFNTSEAYGLIKTIMTDRRLNGKLILSNAIFVATCNPFKAKNKSKMEEELVGLKKEQIRNLKSGIKLQYNVYPIPESLLVYTFNLGHLSEKDEELDVHAILSNVIDSNFKKIVPQIIVESQKFIKEKLDLGTTSLKDLRRFQIIYDFFRNKYFLNFENTEIKNKKVIILTFMTYYYFRLFKPDDRQ